MIFRYLRWLFSSFLIFVFSCTNNKLKNQNTEYIEENTSRIVIYYTNDEHGRIEKSQFTDGAAKMMGLWRTNEGYNGDDKFLILSGGDNWTGPAISTWFKGESTVDVMNAMEYDASAIGNHEFNFQVEGLYDRIEQANFPYLSANIREVTSGKIPDFATPYIIKDIAGIMVGIIGLTTTSTPYISFPVIVLDYNFIDYSTALENIVPQVKKDGAELLIVIAHINYSEMVGLVPVLVDLGISAIGGGHYHSGIVSKIIDGVAVMKSSAFLQNYAKLEITFNTVEKEVVSMEPSTHLNENGNPDQAIADKVSYWRERMDSEISESISNIDGGT
ncbi:MAG: hypothetical protein GWP19_07785 [Planctomycetia bacterium]|nr:hypothetical protein [Planctomycetia bacterium]